MLTFKSKSKSKCKVFLDAGSQTLHQKNKDSPSPEQPRAMIASRSNVRF